MMLLWFQQGEQDTCLMPWCVLCAYGVHRCKHRCFYLMSFRCVTAFVGWSRHRLGVDLHWQEPTRRHGTPPVPPGAGASCSCPGSPQWGPRRLCAAHAPPNRHRHGELSASRRSYWLLVNRLTSVAGERLSGSLSGSAQCGATFLGAAARFKLECADYREGFHHSAPSSGALKCGEDPQLWDIIRQVEGYLQ